MATKKSGKSKKKLNSRQRAFVKALAKGASLKDAQISAGYSSKNDGQSGYQALKQIQQKVPELMDARGLTDDALIEKYLKPLLEARETKFFPTGIKLGRKKSYSVDVQALGIRHQALDTAFKLRGSYAPRDPAEAAQFGIKVVVVDIPRPPKMPAINVSGNGNKPPEDE